MNIENILQNISMEKYMDVAEIRDANIYELFPDKIAEENYISSFIELVNFVRAEIGDDYYFQIPKQFYSKENEGILYSKHAVGFSDSIVLKKSLVFEK